MNIVMFSMTPLFAEKSMGGAQKQLKKIALHLAEEGHQVTLLCTRRSDAMEVFHWHANAKIIPTLRFKQPFPEPYAVPPYHIADAIQQVGDYLREADVFYNHDGGLIFPYVYRDIPAVISLRSVIFSETIQSGFLFQGDALILPSEHTADVWRHTAGRFFSSYAERTHVIHNGLDFSHYQYTAPSERLTGMLPIDPTAQRILLYPHRPEEAKGIRQTINLMDELVNQRAMDDLVVLLPQWIDTGVSSAVRGFYQELEDDIAARGLTEHFIFHDWISDPLMPEYYSLGDLTLVLGNYLETFGNVPYESLACETPALVARVGPYRTMLPDDLVDLVDWDNTRAAADIAEAILNERRRVSDDTLQWLHTNFQQVDMVQQYARIILNATRQAPMPYQHHPLTAESAFRAAPWVFMTDGKLYNDFTGDYHAEPELIELLAANTIITMTGAPDDAVLSWYNAGLIVPLQEQATDDAQATNSQ